MERFTPKRIFAAIAAFFTVLFLALTNYSGTVNVLDGDEPDDKK